MSDYSKKLFSGATLSSADWENHLRAAHLRAPGMTPAAFGHLKTRDGESSYQKLASTLSSLENSAPRLLDLACGDGHLIHSIRQVKPEASIVGIDMSESELRAARLDPLASNVKFKQEMASCISEPTESVDGVLCHLALMLMSPIEPVLAEVRRLVKPGGLFASVIMGEPDPGSLVARYRQTLGAFLREEYPNMGLPLTGDKRVQIRSELRSLFDSAGFEMEIADFEVHFEKTQFWCVVKDMYLVGMLPADQRSELKERIDGMLNGFSESEELGFPLQLITAIRR